MSHTLREPLYLWDFGSHYFLCSLPLVFNALWFPFDPAHELVVVIGDFEVVGVARDVDLLGFLSDVVDTADLKAPVFRKTYPARDYLVGINFTIDGDLDPFPEAQFLFWKGKESEHDCFFLF